jgi:membrane protease YdiL (CAAX protease family)
VGADGLLGYKEIPVEKMPLLFLGMLLGPSIAGIVMTGVESGKAGYRELLGRLRIWRVPIKWYAMALLTAPLLLGLTIFMLSLTSENFIPPILSAEDKISPIIGGIIAGILVGIFEELGWTGFALPKLRKRFSMLATGLLMGFFWGLWHAPLFLGSLNSTGNVPRIIYLAVLLFTVLPAYRVLMVWVYDNTKSLLVGMLMHVPQTIFVVTVPLNVIGGQAVIYNLVYTAGLYILIAIIYNKSKIKLVLKSSQ